MPAGSVDVVIPVGPGHKELAQGAAESVHMAAMLGRGDFTRVRIVLKDDTSGTLGRSEARNKAVAESDAEWIYFLDADDVVTPPLFESVVGHLDAYDAIWGKFGELHGLCLMERFQTWGFSTYDALLSLSAHTSVKIGHFVRRAVALDNPFNVTMNAGEDWDYYLRVWKRYRCIKLGGPVVYAKRKGQHSTGPRAATGADWNKSVAEQMAKARQEHSAMLEA